MKQTKPLLKFQYQGNTAQVLGERGKGKKSPLPVGIVKANKVQAVTRVFII